MDDGLFALLMVGIAAFAFALGAAFQTGTTVNECRDFGKFSISGVVYECRKIGGTP